VTDDDLQIIVLRILSLNPEGLETEELYRRAYIVCDWLQQTKTDAALWRLIEDDKVAVDVLADGQLVFKARKSSSI
jgi:hypothetical protein